MLTSREQADAAFRDYKGIILDLFESIFYIRKGLHEVPDLLKAAKNGIKQAKSPNYRTKKESLLEFYGLQPEYERLEQIAKQIKRSELDSSESQLATMLKDVERYETKNC